MQFRNPVSPERFFSLTLTRSIYKILLICCCLDNESKHHIRRLAVGEVGAGSRGDPCGPSGGVGVANGGCGTAGAVRVVWAGSRGNVGWPGGSWNRCDVGNSVAEGVVGAADGVNSSREEELAGGHADKGSKNSLESVNIVFGLTLCSV